VPPRAAAVVGAVQAEVADQEHPLRVGVHRHGHRRPAAEARQAAARDLVPGDAFVGRLEEFGLRGSRLRAAAGPSPVAGSANKGGAGRRRDVVPHGGRENDLGVV